jgi:hypothetical protein
MQTGATNYEPARTLPLERLQNDIFEHPFPAAAAVSGISRWLFFSGVLVFRKSACG